MSDKNEDSPHAPEDPGEGPSRPTLSARDRDAIVESLFQRLEKAKQDLSQSEETGENAQ